MIERLPSPGGNGLGFKASGALTADDVKTAETQIELAISNSHKKPIGILLDLTALQDVEWKARWEEFRFLKKFGGPIARVAVIGARTWDALMADLAGATVLMQADIRYFQPAEIIHAWHWIHTAKFAVEVPVRQLVSPGHLMSGYHPEYIDI
jgi:hypothetical protein